jgi:hypothetical protein
MDQQRPLLKKLERMRKGQQTEQQYEDQEFANTAGDEKAAKPDSNLMKMYNKAKDIMKGA